MGRAWRCPLCGTQLLVVVLKGRLIFRHRGTVVRVCPGCKGQTRHKPKLQRVYEEATS